MQLGAAPGNLPTRAVAMAAVADEELAYEEVADDSGTIEEAADEDFIPTPPLMDFNLWQKWRKEYGLRPTKRLGSRNPKVRSKNPLVGGE